MFNLAQMLYISFGVPPILLIAHERGPNSSNTKKGPGRKHRQGKEKKEEAKKPENDDTSVEMNH